MRKILLKIAFFMILLFFQCETLEVKKGVHLSAGQTVKIENLEWKKCSEGQKDDATCSKKPLTYDWKSAGEKCKELNEGDGYAGQKGWRLPTKEELMGLVKCSAGYNELYKDGFGQLCKSGYSSPTIDVQKFSNTVADGYWSSSTDVDGTGYAWLVYFSNGYVGSYIKTYNVYVRCVR